MKNHIKHDEWLLIEDSFNPEQNQISESLFSLGNGRMGQRANFEENYTGRTLMGNYVAGIYYPDKTRVNSWKNGYPEYFAKVLNSCNWVGIHVSIDGENLDLATCEVLEFRRVLNMRQGYLQRDFHAKLPSGKEVKVSATRFCSIVNQEIGAIKYSITPVNFDGRILFIPFLDYDIKNQDSNYGEKFWEEVKKNAEPRKCQIVAKTKKTDFHVGAGMKFTIVQNGVKAYFEAKPLEREKYVGNSVSVLGTKGKEITIYKYCSVLSSENHPKDYLLELARERVKNAYDLGFEALLSEHSKAWENKWEEMDIVIEGDIAAQQGIRFNIFQLYQTYTGQDARLNIGPKGFTGEKYGGSTYWDTEAYCLPFFLATADPKVARNLLLYRYKQLPKAIENAQKLGFSKGAALYPMVTMNGEECHNEWETTFEAIHRNGSIAYAIYNFIEYTGDKKYLKEAGLETLIAISRFWAQRVSYSKNKKKYVLLGVTGPNEYESNVNNNWYTNYIATWCLKYTIECVEYVKNLDKFEYNQFCERISFDEAGELAQWNDVVENMYFPDDKKLGIVLQQDGYLDKDLTPASELDATDRPLNKKWSWDRIQRSCYIKQADVLQGLYFFENHFDKDFIKKNFDFYEPLTVHESSLSPCVHAVLASALGYEQKAYELYLRTSRLDLDNYNNDTEEGLHITSMAGTWMSVVNGFGGMRVRNGKVYLNPFIPGKWKSFSFKIQFLGTVLKVDVSQNNVAIENLSAAAIEFFLFDKLQNLKGNDVLVYNQAAKA